MYQPPKRIEYLDSIRGLAALSVVLFHSMVFEWPKPVSFFTNLPIINIAFDGHAAVAMFFVLSGFVLSRPYLIPNNPRSVFLPTFYLRRITRIWLPWFFVFCLTAIVIKFLFRDYDTIPPYGRVDIRNSWHMPLTIFGALQQMALWNLQVAPSIPYMVPQDWSLGIEMKASLLIPFFVFCARARTIAPLLAMIAGISIFLAHGYLVSFILGVCLARRADQITARVSALPRSAFWLLFGVGILLYQSNHILIDLLGYKFSVTGCLWSLSSLGCVLILAAILSHAGMQRFLQHPSCVFLGRISYSIYLLHMLVLFCLQPLVVFALNSLGITSAVILLPVSLGVNVAVTLTLATLTHRYIEMPSIAFGHWLTIRIQNRFAKK